MHNNRECTLAAVRAEFKMKCVFSLCMKLGSYSIMDAALLKVLSFSGDRKLAGGENVNKTTSSTKKQNLT